MTIGSLFSGIGGLELGLEWAGLGETLWQVEIDPFCRGILAKHWPKATRYEDVKEPREYPYVDVICGGFPCQDVSAAGKQAGMGPGTRSGLWSEFARIVGEVRPRHVVVENVASGARRWLPTVRRDLHVLGYDSTAYALSAFDVGAPQLRKRVFVLATNANCIDIREQPRRGERQDRESPTFPARSGKKGLATNAHTLWELQQKGSVKDEWRWISNSDGWSIEPPVCGVAYGVPAGARQLKALGNAVVPQCAEVIGKIIVCSLL